MNKFMVEIKLHDLPMDKIGELAPPEDRMIKEMMDAGVIEKGYVLSDMSGAYIVINADDESDATGRLETLPMFPFMSLEIRLIQDMV